MTAITNPSSTSSNSSSLATTKMPSSIWMNRNVAEIDTSHQDPSPSTTADSITSSSISEINTTANSQFKREELEVANTAADQVKAKKLKEETSDVGTNSSTSEPSNLNSINKTNESSIDALVHAANTLHLTLHEYANKLLHEKDEDGGYITAISLTAQCGNSPPVSVAGGTNGITDLSPIKENSIFQIGSVTKAFVCIVVLQLAEENKISIDDNTVMMKWFPEYPKWGNITLAQLMNMTSGIPGNGNRLPDDIFKKFTAKEYYNWIDPDQILNLTYQLPLHFEPGTSFEYSNTNYTLLGRFIKKITHSDPEKEITERVINKLGLHNTHFPVDLEEDVPNIDKSQLVHGYAFFSKNSDPYPFITHGADTLPYSLSSANTGGAIISTPHDINMFLHAIFNNDGVFHRYQKQLTTFVSRNTGEPMTEPTEEDRQGFGLGIIGYHWDAAHPIIYLFNGTMDGFKFAWIVNPESQVYLAFAINSHADLITLESVLSLFEKIENSITLKMNH